MHAHLPPTFNILKNNVKNKSSVFFVLHTFSKSPETDSASRLPLNGGFANTNVYLSLSEFWSDKLSRYSIHGLSIP